MVLRRFMRLRLTLLCLSSQSIFALTEGVRRGKIAQATVENLLACVRHGVEWKCYSA